MSCRKWEKGSLDQVDMPNPAPMINVTCSQLPHLGCLITTLEFFWKLAMAIHNFNYIGFDYDKKDFVLVHLHRHWPECHPKRVPDAFPCLLERQLSEDRVRLPLHVSNSFFPSSSKDMHVLNLMCRGGDNKWSGESTCECRANRNKPFNEALLVYNGWPFFIIV